jgi:hypothetical protein
MIPPAFGRVLLHQAVPPPLGLTGILILLASFNIWEISSDVSGVTVK